MQKRTLITTSHRPTRNTRRFIKALSKLIPNAIRVNRGKLTLKLLALHAIDTNCDNVLIVRNRRGNPGFIDLYAISYPLLEITKVCTLKICGYSIDEKYKQLRNIKVSILRPISILNEFEVSSKLLECFLKTFNISLDDASLKTSDQSICVHIKKSRNRDGIEVVFSDCNTNTRYMLIRLCE